MQIALEAYLCPDETDPEIQYFTAFGEAAESYGFTPGLENLLLQDSVMRVSYLKAMSLTMSTEAAEQVAAASGAAAEAVGEKSKGLVARILTKLGNFLSYVGDKVMGFVKSISNRVGHASVSGTAKAATQTAVNGSLDALPKTAAAVNSMAGVANEVASNPQAASGVMGKVSNILGSIKTNAFKIIPFKSGEKVNFKTTTAAGSYPKVSAKVGGWSRPSLGGMVTKFSNGAHAIWSALKSFLSAIKKLVMGTAKLGGGAVKAPVKLGDKVAAGTINKLQGISLKGGLKGFAAGMASIMLVTYLVNTVLKLIKAALNFASGMVHDTVDAICGPET